MPRCWHLAGSRGRSSSAAGASQNRTFTVSYVKGNNLMGLNGATTADAYANRPATSQYQPSTQYDSTDQSGHPADSRFTIQWVVA